MNEYELAFQGVYVMTGRGGWPSKVGRSSDILHRRRQLQGGNWHEIFIYHFTFAYKHDPDRVRAMTFNGVTDSAVALEAAVHRQLKELDAQLLNEWFDIDAGDAVAVLEKVAEKEGFRLFSGKEIADADITKLVHNEEKHVWLKLLKASCDAHKAVDADKCRVMVDDF